MVLWGIRSVIEKRVKAEETNGRAIADEVCGLKGFEVPAAVT